MLITSDSYIGKMVRDYINRKYGQDCHIIKIWQPLALHRVRRLGQDIGRGGIRVKITKQGDSEAQTIKLFLKDLR